MKAIDWSGLFKKYKGMWIGLKKDQKTVVASGKTVVAVMARAKKKNYAQPILLRVPTRALPYVGGFGL